MTFLDRGPGWLRARLKYIALALVTIAIGLSVHRSSGILSPNVKDVLGDALWAAMVMWWTGVVAPGAPLLARTAAAVGVCFAVELSQLYHAPWLDSVRRTTVGHLVLGSDFFPRDFLAYTAGVVSAALLERALFRT